MSRRTLLSLGFAVAMAAAAGARGMPAQFPGLPGMRSQAAPTGTGVIAGHVVDSVTGRPVPGAVVGIAPAPAGLASMQVGDTIPMDQLMSLDLGTMISGIRQVLTDAQGRFAFTGVPKGTFSLAATKPGWMAGQYGQRRPDAAPLGFDLAEGERATNVTLQLWKNSVITGTVVDEASEPIVGLSVRAMRRTWTAGHARYSMAGMGQTDDRGTYRVTGLRSGDYIVAIAQTPVTMPAAGGGASTIDVAALQAMVAGGAAGSDPSALMANLMSMMSSRGGGGIRVGNWVLQTSSVVPPVLTPDGRMFAYRTTFFPSASVSSQSTAIAIGAAEDRSGIDLQLRPVPVVRISGVATAPDGPLTSTQIRLLPATGDDTADDTIDSATTTTAGDGSFTFLAVPPGQYMLRVVRPPKPAAPSAAAMAAVSGMDQAVIQNASGGMTVSMGSMNIGSILGAMPPIPADPTLFASVPVSVGETDVTGLAVMLRPAFRITGRAEFEGAAKKPTPDELRRLPISIERADVGSAAPVPTPMLGNGQGGQFDANGQFTTFGLLPGKYFVRVPFSTGGWTLKSAVLGGKDVADTPLEIENGDVSGVVLTFTDQRSELSGVVRNAQGAADAKAAVVVFPTTPESWVDFGSAPRRLRVGKTDKEGRYRVAGLPAGNYFVTAVPDEIGGDWQNPQVLDALSRGAARVTIADGEKRAQDLRVNR